MNSNYRYFFFLILFLLSLSVSSQRIFRTEAPLIFENGVFIKSVDANNDSLIVICDPCEANDTMFVSLVKIDTNFMIVRTYHKNRKIKTKYSIRNGLREGPYYTYFKSGALEKLILFHVGKSLKPITLFYESGNLMHFSNLDDKNRIGKALSYYENGEPKGETYFNDSSQEAIYNHYYESGNINITSFGDTGNQTYKEFYEGGNIKVTGKLHDGLSPIGEWKKYYENGKLMFVKKFRWDSMVSRPDGIWEFYDEIGNLLKKETPDYYEQIMGIEVVTK